MFGVGIDLVSIPRFDDFLRRNRSDLNEVYTSRELLAASESGSRDSFLATRWALKEAFLKALGTGWAAGVQWTDVEGLGELLRPSISFNGVVAQLADELGASLPIASVARSGDLVIAVAMLIGHG